METKKLTEAYISKKADNKEKIAYWNGYYNEYTIEGFMVRVIHEKGEREVEIQTEINGDDCILESREELETLLKIWHR